MASPKEYGLPSGSEQQHTVEHLEDGVPRLVHHHQRHQAGPRDVLEGADDVLADRRIET